MKKYPTYTLIDTSYIPTYEEYVEDCSSRDVEPQGENSSDYWDFVAEYHVYDWDDFKSNLKYSKEANAPVLVSGKLGLWDGTHTIYPMKCDSLIDAIQKCANSADNIKVEVDCGVIHVYAYHHDGVNNFDIHKISKKGLKVIDNWRNGRSETEEIKKYWISKFNGYLF